MCGYTRNEKRRWMYFSIIPHTDIEQVERNQTHATLQCKTDLHQIIWKIRKIGRTRRFEARQYERDGNFVTATTTILVNETINVTCIGKARLSSERDHLTLHPYEGLRNLNSWLLSTYDYICTKK